ncbi:MAG TPA: hypothetical protein VFZ53_08705 [Polyangiaceae bacterium]
MSRANAIYSALISAVVGVTAAIATVTLMDRSSGEREASPAPEKALPSKGPATESTRTIIVQSDAERLRSIEERLDGIKKAGERSAAPSGPPDLEERRRRIAEKAAELDRIHREETPDPAWSTNAVQSLSKGLGELEETLGFSLRDADCKTTRCRAVVDWRDRESAERNVAQLAERSFPGLNCEQTVLRTESADSRTFGTATLYLNCSDQRAGLVQGFVK